MRQMNRLREKLLGLAPPNARARLCAEQERYGFGRQEVAGSGRRSPAGSDANSAIRVARLDGTQVRYRDQAFNRAAFWTGSRNVLSLSLTLPL
jgi:hypothetical protein